MIPEEAIKEINNLLISLTKNGVQDGSSLLDAYRYFNECIEKRGVQKPVLVLMDGHSSRFDYDVLKFCSKNNIHLFVGPPDTTGVTQLLDQINHKLHHEYRLAKNDTFMSHESINRNGFMLILILSSGQLGLSRKQLSKQKSVCDKIR